MIGTWEIILIILIVLILFGADKIPEFVKAINVGIKEFKKATDTFKQDSENINKEKDI
tara:strand:- start:244 stop:417 length:174 start_codon:yes stop_codon:yes gene_type:complete